jgi:hypothetical protein
MKWLNIPALISAAIMFATTGEATWRLFQSLATSSKDGRISKAEKGAIRADMDFWLASFPEDPEVGS